MKESIKQIINKYLNIFPDEKDRLLLLSSFLNKFNNEEIIDWNNKEGHITVGAFIYQKSENKFLVLYHRDLKMYLYPGGHIEKSDKTLLDAAKRELKEETSLENLNALLINNETLPFDIDTHIIPDNDRINIPSHYHFDFRFLFFVENLTEINFDKEEFKDYKWITLNELIKDKNYSKVIDKLKKLLKNNKNS